MAEQSDCVRSTQPPAPEGPNDAENPEQSLNICQIISSSNSWRVLVYGLIEDNLPLLGGILGHQVLPADILELPHHSYEKNGVKVEIHNGSQIQQGAVPYENVDLLLVHLPIYQEQRIDLKMTESLVKEITQKHRPMIWKHSIFIFTGASTIVESYQERGNVSVRFEAKMEHWVGEIKTFLRSALANTEGLDIDDILTCIPTGTQEDPDLPHLYKNWLSVLWHTCFYTSKDNSMPALLKISQDRIKHKEDKAKLKQQPFHEQAIVTPNKDLAEDIKLRLGLAGGSAVTGAAVTGAAIGATIGTLAIGIPTFGAAAGSGLVIGAVVGGGVGAGLAGAAIGGGVAAKKHASLSDLERHQIAANFKVSEASEFKLSLIETLRHLPNTSKSLNDWVQQKRLFAEKPINCKVGVTGVVSEGVSTVAASITRQRVRPNSSGFYSQVIDSLKANLLVYDLKGFPKMGKMLPKAQDIIKKKKDIHLLIFCIPMLGIDDEFTYSAHVDALKQLSEEDPDIFSHTVIALTHANEVGTQHDPQSRNTRAQFFAQKLDFCKKKIRYEFIRKIRLEKKNADKVPIVPLGYIDDDYEEGPVYIDLSEPNGNQRHHYYWLSQLLLLAMSATKPEGLPALIKCNRKRIKACPDEYAEQRAESEDQFQEAISIVEAKRLLVEAQCSMFSGMGLKHHKNKSGEAVGQIMGANDIYEQDW